MANYNRDFNPFLFPSTSIAYSPVSYSSSSLSSSPPPSQSISSTFQSSSSLPLLPPQYSSSSVHPPAGATATAVPISCTASAVDGAFGATNIVKSPLDSSPGGEPAMDLRDWRVHLQPDSRRRIVSKIAETLMRHLPFSGEGGLQEIKKIAVRFEEKVYDSATSESDYLRKISLKMLTMENRTQDNVPSSAPSYSSVCSNEVQVQEDDGEPAVNMCDWRAHLQLDSRQRIVNKIAETLKRHLLLSDEEALQEIKKIAARFEEKIYVDATSQSDYLRKISLKMLTMESKASK
ncbi:uncharacterized protein LOC110625810 [Manihot esculenta]|uniref:Mediator complex subunit 15 KIX domain-containing protein n=1 Tax=Manihot esculenta TaxID=3983 RepID=A0A251JSS9_MANES|nr:uncharacterized protein LOC110625810 [Manihot esculenta]OAY36944.1 hypothetical protein MANES_11G062000v8 [Manihot esculenta]OAY36945.1 hypothetical protein MANES_11G062000v8 [Manihot esculenta]